MNILHLWAQRCTAALSVEVLGTGVFVWVHVREGKTHCSHKRSFHPSHVHWVSFNHRNTQSCESKQFFCFFSNVGPSVCVRVSVLERASKREGECMSLNAISGHLWQSLKGVKLVLGCVGVCQEPFLQRDHAISPQQTPFSTPPLFFYVGNKTKTTMAR